MGKKNIRTIPKKQNLAHVERIQRRKSRRHEAGNGNPLQSGHIAHHRKSASPLVPSSRNNQ